MSDSQHVLEHPTLNCSLRGKHGESTIQYRNLKYATIPARFKDSTLNDILDVGVDGVFDATRFGPSSPQKRGGQKLDLALMGSTRIALPYEDGQGKQEIMSELDCLHLSITAPDVVLKNGKPLPVFVWVHGGGFGIGSNSWPQYDLRRFVERSARIGKPVLGVSINYRLGIFGILASEEVGAKGNMGYKDITQAFFWIKKHIAGFGGNPNQVTAAGNSAGAIALSTILSADTGNNAMFERVLLMSGEATVRKPRSSYWHKRFYQDQIQYLGVSEADTTVKRSKLLDTNAQDLAEKLPPLQHYCAHIDGSWLKSDITVETMADGRRPEHKPYWCKQFVIGDTKHDGTVVKAKILDRPDAFDSLKSACRKHLNASQTHRLFDVYGLSGSRSVSEIRAGLCLMFSEIRFYVPALTALQGWRTSSQSRHAHGYHFHVPNPFNGIFEGLASHELDVAYLLQNFREHFNETDRHVANQISDQVIGYVNGEGWVDQGRVVVFDENGIDKVREGDYDQVYRNGRGKLLDEIGRVKLWDLAEAWMGVRSDHERCAKI